MVGYCWTDKWYRVTRNGLETAPPQIFSTPQLRRTARRRDTNKFGPNISLCLWGGTRGRGGDVPT